ncbi:FAD-dependent monooxygenase [Rhodoferax aquaticus]|uniref:FAD-dependent oxidoreductase n=1 Tax=Rhodoferax aquaticus TaxID=2527691 RepID=A0A515EMQ5_9BURK|nr:FAD-dependent monooxygenase [Rhodoferax aquaticus]QDL53950.1 FAD-dependent oxidoreductase [Rhodoferax aquaticus]
MDKKILIVGGGIGGMAAALACTRSGLTVRLTERAAAFGEVGAGVQLGPNSVQVLEGWGLGKQLKAVAAFPQELCVRNAKSGAVLARMPLGKSMVEQYGSPYATIARADLHSLLLTALCRSGSARLMLDSEVTSVTQDKDSVSVQLAAPEGHSPQILKADVLVGADGLWSRVRSQILHTGGPRVTGHLAYRAMLKQSDLPVTLRSQVVTAWMGPGYHVVQYPVGAGEWLNVVAIVHGELQGDLASWDHSGNAKELRIALAGAASPLWDLLHAIPDWRLWALCDRPPMRSAAEHAVGRVALLGDAAHPMRPYLAQGAGMALEDAAELARVLVKSGVPVDKALRAYAARRWRRNAKVQARSIRNGHIFHLRGPFAFGRDATLRLLGKRVLDVPWLYQGPDQV